MSFDHLLRDNGDEDEILAKVQEESLRFFREVELPRSNLESIKNEGNVSANEIFTSLPNPCKSGTSRIISIDELDKTGDLAVLCTQVGGKAGALLFEGEEAKGFHLAAGSSYIYPTNYPIRQYQTSIVRSAIFKNTLVGLPTGLGKTFIAAVVMYNFYRWYPRGKVVFMAPTRPLVAQQIKACYSIMGIPPTDTTELTGITAVEARKKLWDEKRVFFLTPQVMVNDLRSNICPAESVKCIVVDEAHKAVKDYAYCQVIKLLGSANAVYRTLALSATPGNDINAVVQVIRNLNVSCLEMRGEDSIDVSPYTHGKSIEHVVVDLSPEVLRVKEDFLQVYERFARSLVENRALTSNIAFLTKFQILKSMEKFRANPPRGMSSAMIGSLVSDFTMCMTLAHALELLQIYGLRAFYRYLADEDGEKSKAAVTRLRNNDDLQRMLRLLHGILYPKPNADVPYVWGHPKLKKLVDSLSDHFKSAEDKGEPTKAIVFCNYKVVVNEIVDLLNKCKPLIRATLFVGQSGGKERGMPQAKQMQIMKEFREGKLNCLVATCVAEEGLDIGEVDLIVLMESQKSPVRLVQRLGRTGRKRRGKCIVLLTRGKEESKFHEAMASRKSYVRNIVESRAVKNSLCQYSPLMLPPGTKPQQQLVHIKVVNTETPTKPIKQVKKQMDIRDCAVTESRPFLDDGAEKQVLEELQGTKLEFNILPERMELWHRQSDLAMGVDELLDGKTNSLASWNDWNKELQCSFVMSNTAASQTLCHLLSYHASNDNQEYVKLVEEFENHGEVALERPKNDQTHKKSAEIPDDEKKCNKKKVMSKKNLGMDIRSCMATAVEKAKRPKLDLNTTGDDIIIVEPTHIEDVEIRIESEKPTLKKETLTDTSEVDFQGIFGMSAEEFESIVNGGELLCGLERDIGACLRLSKYVGRAACFAPKPDFVNLEKFKFQCDQLLKIMDSVDEIRLKPTDFMRGESPDVGNAQDKTVIESQVANDSFVDIDDLLEDEVEVAEVDCRGPCDREPLKIQAEGDNTEPIPCTEKKNGSLIWSSHPCFAELSPIGKSTNPTSYLISSTPISARFSKNNETNDMGHKEDQWILDDILELDEGAKKHDSSRDLFAPSPSCMISGVKKANNKANVFKEPTVPSEGQKTDEVEEDIWCLDDLFDESKSPDGPCFSQETKNETTFIGITQMVSQIERDKKKTASDVFERIVDSPSQVPSKSLGSSLEPSSFVVSDYFAASGALSDNISASTNISLRPSLANASYKCSEKSVKLPSVRHNLSQIDEVVVVDSDSFKSNESPLQNKNILPQKISGAVEKPAIGRKKQSQTNRSLLEEDDDIFSVLTTGGILDREIPKQCRSDCSLPMNVKKFKPKSVLSSLDKQPDNDSIPEQGNSDMKVGGMSKRKLSFEDLLDNIGVETTSKYFARDNQNEISSKHPIASSVSSKTREGLFRRGQTDGRGGGTKAKRDEVTSDDDDIFVHQGAQALVTRNDCSSSSASPSITPVEHVKLNKKAKKKRNAFIEIEAEESGILSADDSDNSSLDDMDDSFVDDECDQEQSYAHYLKSVKSPIVGGKFKIPMNRRYMDNVYSQVVNREDDDYENDSFCVGSDEEQSEDESTILEGIEKELVKRKRITKKGSRKRIIKPADDGSDYEERVVNLEDSVVAPGAPGAFKKRLLDSDSDVTPDRAFKRPRIVSPLDDEDKSIAQYDLPSSEKAPPGTPKRVISPIYIDSGSDEELKEAIRLSKLESTKKMTDEERFEDDLQKALLLSQFDAPEPSTSLVPGPSSETVRPTLTDFPDDQGTSLLFMSQPILRDKRPFSTKSKPKSKPENAYHSKRIFQLSDSD